MVSNNTSLVNSYMNPSTSEVTPANTPNAGSHPVLNLQTGKDEFVKSDKDKNKTWKWAGIIGGTASAIALAVFYIRKNKFFKVKQLAEHINFQKAESVEDAIRFGQENLGIRNYTGFEAKDLEVLNWVNEGLTNVSNKMNGKVRMPKGIGIVNQIMDSDFAFGGIIKEGEFKDWFAISRAHLNKIDTSINNTYEGLKGCLDKCREKGAKLALDLDCELMRRFKQNPSSLSFAEKIKLYNHMCFAKYSYETIACSPFSKIKEFLTQENLAILKNKGIETNIENIATMSTEDQGNLLFSMMKEISSHTEKPIILTQKPSMAHHLIYHEMGHVQDMVPRVEAKEMFDNPNEYPKVLKEWLENKDHMQTAAEVSTYSQSGPGEFIAETFAELINGHNVSDRVKALYRELKGPPIPGII